MTKLSQDRNVQIQLGCRANRSKPVTFEVGGNNWIARMRNYLGVHDGICCRLFSAFKFRFSWISSTEIFQIKLPRDTSWILLYLVKKILLLLPLEKHSSFIWERQKGNMTRGRREKEITEWCALISGLLTKHFIFPSREKRRVKQCTTKLKLLKRTALLK